MCYYHLGSSLHFLGKEWVRGDDNPILEFRQLIMDCHSSSWIIMDQQQHHHHHHHLHHKYYQLDIISIYHCCHRCHRCQNNYGGWKMKKLTGNQQVKPHQRYSRNGRYLCIWRVAQQLQSEGLKQPDPRNYNDALPESHWYPADLTLTPQPPPRRALRGLADLHTKLSTRTSLRSCAAETHWASGRWFDDVWPPGAVLYRCQLSNDGAMIYSDSKCGVMLFNYLWYNQIDIRFSWSLLPHPWSKVRDSPMTGILSASQPNWIACVLERVNEDPPRPWQKHHLATQSHADFGERTWVCKRICYRYDSAKPSTKLPRSEIFQLFGNHVLSGYPHISYIYIQYISTYPPWFLGASQCYPFFFGCIV